MDDKNPQTLGDLLRHERQKRGMTQNRLATRAGITPSTLCRWEAGATHPGVPELTAVLDVLGIKNADTHPFIARICAPRGLRKLRQLQNELQAKPNAPTLPVPSLLAALRRRKGVTQTEAARGTGVAQAQIARWEKGEAWPDDEKLHRLCWFLEAAPEEIAALSCAAKNALGASGADGAGAAWEAFLPNAADAGLWHETLRRLLHKPPPRALTDLVFIAAETRLWELTPRHDFAKNLLPTVYALHARRHLATERPDLALHWAHCGLSLACTRPINVDNQPLWFGSVIAIAAAAGHKAAPSGLRRAVRLVQDWLPHVEPCAAHFAWGNSVLAAQLARLGHVDAAEKINRNACVRAEYAKPIERPLRLLDRAALLREMHQPAEALQTLEACRPDLENNSTYNYVRHRLLETDCLLALGSRAEAQERVRLAERAVEIAPIRTPLEAPLRAIAAKMNRSLSCDFV